MTLDEFIELLTAKLDNARWHVDNVYNPDAIAQWQIRSITLEEILALAKTITTEQPTQPAKREPQRDVCDKCGAKLLPLNHCPECTGIPF